MVLFQEKLIKRVRSLCTEDAAMVAALTYGSFPQGLGDEHSDVEFWLFFEEPGVEPQMWLTALEPYEHVVVNEFGTHVVFFPGLVRGEFHFASAEDIRSVASWPARSAPVREMVLLDRTGELSAALRSLPDRPPVPSTPDDVNTLCGRFANWLVLAVHVRSRGEELRALDAIAHARRHLLWMSRLAESRTGNWLTPSRRAEADLPAPVVAAIGSADLKELWRCGRDCWTRLGEEYKFDPPATLFQSLDAVMTATSADGSKR